MDREKVVSGLETIRYNLRQMNHGLLADFCDDAIALLKEQPDVVRCKDCKKYNTDECEIDKLEYSPAYGGWFCADGERKEGR